ncbi:alpha-amylase family glycosyl hydrolase [Metabacillus halosaccharovorans]|uniref:alpha-amylase family glycosyl hydrolase n=1 Tax=Metabacillus halosaccharovorans TaxID=930124 RepID=UPI00403D9938
MFKRAGKFLLILFLLLGAIPVNAAEKEERAWQDEIAYYVVVDRFNNGNSKNDGDDLNFEDPTAYHGGDIEGITKKIEYIHEMGFTSIILSPIFNEENNAVEVKTMDEHAGTVEDVKKLVEEAHKLDMNILLDYGEIDQNLTQTASWWINETDVDGYYIEQADSIDVSVWNQFHKDIEELKEDYYLVGSIGSKDENVSSYLENGFDSILNQSFYEETASVFSNVDQSFQPITEIIAKSSPLLSTYVDNDRTVRFTRHAIENNQHPGVRLKMAFSYMYTIPGTPFVYYGSEIAVDGGEPPTNRPLMNFQSDEELIEYLGKLSIVRKTFPALTRGDYEVLYEKDGMIIFKRSYQDESLIVAINNTTETQKVKIPAAEIAENNKLEGLLTGDTFEEENDEYEFIIDREIAEVYEIKGKTGLNIPFISVFIIVPTLFILFLVMAYRKGKQKS